ncbi:SEP domain-containing protein [Apiospora arundinis]
MSEYTSTREGFQRAMEWSLTGRPEDTKQYVEATTVPTFYQVMNGQRIAYDDYVKGIVQWRGKVTDYKPIVHEFLRDADQLAARMTGSITVGGAATAFESFMFAKVDKETGKLEWLVERSVWGPTGGSPEHGTN